MSLIYLKNQTWGYLAEMELHSRDYIRYYEVPSQKLLLRSEILILSHKNIWKNNNPTQKSAKITILCSKREFLNFARKIKTNFKQPNILSIATQLIGSQYDDIYCKL